MPRQRVVLCLLSICVAVLPMALFLSHSLQVDSAHEWVYYRIGHALSIMGGEADFVRPIQGIPNAILSKAIVWILGDAVVTRAGYRAYGLLFSLLLALPLVAALCYSWLKLPPSVAVAQTLIAALPFWFGSASDGLMVAPDYWQAELVFLVVTLPLVYELRKIQVDKAYLVAGLWAGLGASIKITLFPVSLLLLASLSPWITLRRIAVALGAAFVMFYALDLLYMLDVTQTAKLLKFQILFYLYPNESAYYPDFWTAFFVRPLVPLLCASVVLMCAWKRNLEAAAIAAWIVVYLYLVGRRPHDTSMASFAMSLGFMAAFMALQLERRALALSGLFVLALTCAYLRNFHEVRNFLFVQSYDRANVAATEFFRPAAAAWFMPTNHWNATFGPQGLAYNGGLAIYRPKESLGVFRKFFPGVEIVLTPEEAGKAYAKGEAIYWTRLAVPDDDAYPRLRESLAGAKIIEQRGKVAGREWIFGKAVH